MAALAGQKVALCRALNPFGNHRQSKAPRQGDHHFGNGRIICIRQNVPHKTLVNLELVQRQAFQVREGGVARAKVVQREAHTVGLERCHFGDDVFNVGHQQTLCQLQLEPLWVRACLCQHAHHLVSKVGLVKLTGAHIDCDGEVGPLRACRPLRQLLAGSFQHPMTNRQNETRFLCQRDELGR